MKEFYSQEPPRVEVASRRSGVQDLYLRRDIEFVEGEDGGRWEADERRMAGAFDAAEVVADFDAYWAAAGRAAMTQAERLTEVEAAADEADGRLSVAESALADTDAALCELYEMLIGD